MSLTPGVQLSGNFLRTTDIQNQPLHSTVRLSRMDVENGPQNSSCSAENATARLTMIHFSTTVTQL